MMTSTVIKQPAVPGAATPQQIVLQAGFAYVVSACLNVAVKLGVPDLLGDAGMDIEHLALDAGADEEYLFRVLRVLEMNQLVARKSPHHWELTTAGQLLRRNVPGSLAAGAEWLSDPLHLRLYSHLRGSIETGTTTFDAVHGKPFFHWLSEPENEETAFVFNHAMTSFSEMCIPAILEAYDFGGFTKIVDIGGGHGSLLRAILKEYTNLRGAVAEMPVVVPDTKAAIALDGLDGRCDAIACNFFESAPAGSDAYLMKHIIHDWADEPALRILRNIRAVIPADGKLLLAEAVLDDSPAPHFGKLLDIEMIAFVGGKERTREEFRELLGRAGFALERVVQTASPLSLLEAVPA